MAPAPFSDEERERTRAALLLHARLHFERYGYRRTNVAEIAREAGIGKGTVYLFFRSKAELFAAVAVQVEEEVRARLEQALAAHESAAAWLEHFLRFQFEAFDDYPLLAVLTDADEARALFRELPPAAAELLRASDERYFAELSEPWRQSGELGVDAATFAALPRALFALRMQRELIGDAFDSVVELLITGLGTRVVRKPAGAA